MKNLGVDPHIIGMPIICDRSTYTKYSRSLIQKVKTPLPTPKFEDENAHLSKFRYDQSIVGSLMYVMVATWLDIAFTMGVVNRFLSNHGKKH